MKHPTPSLARDLIKTNTRLIGCGLWSRPSRALHTRPPRAGFSISPLLKKRGPPSVEHNRDWQPAPLFLRRNDVRKPSVPSLPHTLVQVWLGRPRPITGRQHHAKCSCVSSPTQTKNLTPLCKRGPPRRLNPN